MKRRTILSLGSINADFQVRVQGPVGSSDMLRAHDFSRFSGGKSSNTAFLAARFGHNSQLIGRVGDDELATQALAALREAGVNIEGVSVAKGQPTGVSMIMVPPDAKKHIVLATNANDCWDEDAARAMEERIDKCGKPACLVLNYEIPAWVARRALQAAERSGISVVLDPSFADRIEPELFSKLLAITPNITETGGLVGRDVATIEEAARAAQELHQGGTPIVCVKLGDGGCVLATDENLTHIPPEELDPVDTTGAGDAFTGVLAVALLEGVPAREAAAWGVASANLAVTGYGSQPAYRTREEITRLAATLLDRAEELNVET